jgi:4-hydroxy-tetrahydrodipicolinate reductase
MIPVVVWGAGGRMGKRLINLVLQQRDLELVGAVETEGHQGVFQDAGFFHGLPETGVNISMTCQPDDTKVNGIVIDFSLSGGLAAAAQWAQKHKWVLVSGTTALNDQDRLALSAAAEHIPAIYAPNFSIGIQALLHVVSQTSAILPDNFDATIHETHHKAKTDRPSGTAVAFEHRVKNSGVERYLETTSHRAGMIFGEHVIRFVSPMEEITLTHRALDRDVFAFGAISAGRWLLKKSPGLYALTDMLDI